MGNRHIIEHAVIDMTFSSEDLAFEQQAMMSDYVQRRLMPVVDEVFTEYGPVDKVLRLDRLEIDLGPMGDHGFQDEMPRRLRERLGSVLREQLRSIETASTATEAVLSQPRSQFERLEYFLRTGRLPWQANPTDSENSDRMLQRIVESSSEQLVTFLKQSAARERPIQRLVNQFPVHILAGIVRALVSGYSSAIVALIDDLRTVPMHMRARGPVNRDLGQSLWKALIEELVVLHGTIVHPKDLVDRVLRRVSLYEGATYSQLLALVAHEAVQADHPQEDHVPLIAILNTLRTTENGTQRHALPADVEIAKIAPFPDGEEDAEMGAAEWDGVEVAVPLQEAHLRTQMVEAMVRSRVAGIEAMWPMLVQEHAAWLEGILRQYGRRAEVRHTIAWNFTDSMLRELVGIVEPGAREFIDEVIERPELFQRASDAPPAEPGRQKKRLWECTLAYLLVERGSRFNARAYLGSVIRQMAAHDNLGERDLLRSLTAALDQIRASSAMHRKLVQMLRELATEHEDRPSPAAESKKSSEAVIRAYDLYAGLAGRLYSEGGRYPEDVSELTTLLNDLIRECPWQLQRFYRELQAGVLSWAQAVASLSANELRQLITAVLSGTSPGGADFIQAMDTAATRARHANLYYEQIFACLMLNQVIDLEAILAGNRSAEKVSSEDTVLPPDREVPLSTELQQRHLSSPLTPSADDKRPFQEARLRTRLVEAMVRGHVADIEAMWPMLVQEHAAWLEEILRQYGRRTEIRHTIAWNFTDSMLRELLGTVEPSALDLIDEVIGRPELFQRATGAPNAETGHQQKRLWECTLTYLLVERGSRFNARAYLGSVIRQMAAHDNLRERDLLLVLMAGVKQVTGSNRLHHEFVQLLEELALEQEDRPMSAANAAVAGEIVLRAYDAQPDREAPRSTESQGGHSSTQIATLPEDELAAYLKESYGVTPEEIVRLTEACEQVLSRQPTRLRRVFEASLDNPKAVTKLIELLPERCLTRILFLLRADQHAQAQQAADTIVMAGMVKGFCIAPERLHRLKWQFLFTYLVLEGRPFDEKRFAVAFVDYLAKQSDTMDAKEIRAFLARQLAMTMLPSTRSCHLALIDALSQTADDASIPMPRRLTFETPNTGSHREQEIEDEPCDEEIYIANAGLVLAAPYLPSLFDRLYLTEQGAFKDRKAAERAVHLLQYLINERTASPEYQLVLNKLLCGVRTGTPIAREIALIDPEQEIIEGLIQGMIRNWTSIGQTSSAGLRQSFLQREGRLQRKEDAWHLLVEPRAYDVLLDQIPWSFSIIKYPWMERILHVDWR
ncbi:contractile injection system tape measure protein [Nitrospira sp. Nam74]